MARSGSRHGPSRYALGRQPALSSFREWSPASQSRTHGRNSQANEGPGLSQASFRWRCSCVVHAHLGLRGCRDARTGPSALRAHLDSPSSSGITQAGGEIPAPFRLCEHAHPDSGVLPRELSNARPMPTPGESHRASGWAQRGTAVSRAQRFPD
jgi:hypothetical protein